MDEKKDDIIDPNKQKLDAFFGGDLQENPSDDLLNRMESFITDHCTKLNKLTQNITDNINNTDTWDSRDDFIRLNVKPYENINNPIFLIEDRTDNPIFNKTITVFSVLCQEMIELKNIAKNEYYNPLIMFGIIPIDIDSNNSNNNNSNTESNEMQMARFLPFLQNLSNFIMRTYAVIKNCLENIAYLYHPKQKLYIATYKHVNLDYVWENLSSTLTILLTFDIIIKNNHELKSGWENYKKMIGYIRTTPEQLGFDTELLGDFQHQIMRLETTILNNNIFKNCINQKFGLFSKVPTHIQQQYNEILKQDQIKDEQLQQTKSIIQQTSIVSVNRALFEEMDRYFKFILSRTKHELNKQNEIHPRQCIVDFFSLYALQNKIFDKSASQNKKFYKELWSIQKQLR